MSSAAWARSRSSRSSWRPARSSRFVLAVEPLELALLVLQQACSASSNAAVAVLLLFQELLAQLFAPLLERSQALFLALRPPSSWRHASARASALCCWSGLLAQASWRARAAPSRPSRRSCFSSASAAGFESALFFKAPSAHLQLLVERLGVERAPLHQLRLDLVHAPKRFGTIETLLS